MRLILKTGWFNVLALSAFSIAIMAAAGPSDETARIPQPAKATPEPLVPKMVADEEDKLFMLETIVKEHDAFIARLEAKLAELAQTPTSRDALAFLKAHGCYMFVGTKHVVSRGCDRLAGDKLAFSVYVLAKTLAAEMVLPARYVYEKGTFQIHVASDIGSLEWTSFSMLAELDMLRRDRTKGIKRFEPLSRNWLKQNAEIHGHACEVFAAWQPKQYTKILKLRPKPGKSYAWFTDKLAEFYPIEGLTEREQTALVTNAVTCGMFETVRLRHGDRLSVIKFLSSAPDDDDNDE